jgi:glutathione peroxidase-family protein
MPATAFDLGAPYGSDDGGKLAVTERAGRPVLIGDTASQGAVTRQYHGLQDLYDWYSGKLGYDRSG